MSGVEIALIAGGLGTAMSVAGSLQQGSAQKAAADFNAARMDEQAQQSRSAAAAEAEQKARVFRGKFGEASAAYGASGVTTEGTPLLKMADLAAEAELDRQITLYRGNIQARSAESQAAMDRFEGKQAKKASYYQVASTILGNVSQYGSKKAWFENAENT